MALSCLKELSKDADTVAVFDRTTRLTVVDGGFEVDLSPAWGSLAGIHGGYLNALAVRAAAAGEPGRSPRTLSASFLRPARPGPARLEVQADRRGRSLTTVRVELSQDGRPITVSRVTLVAPEAEQAGVDWAADEPIPLPPIERCEPLEVRRPDGIAHFDHGEARLDPAGLPFSGGAVTRIRGYLRPREPRPIDAPWLAMAVDWFPPAAFVRVDPPVGGVSVDLTAHVHRTLPALGPDGWLAVEFEVRTSSAGLAVEHGRIATLSGVTLAESLQTRWTAAT